MDKDIRKHKFVVFAEEYHYNPVGVIRSLGIEGITPDLIAYGEREHVAAASKYVGKVYHVKDVEEGFRVLMDHYGHEEYKPFVITCDDKVTSFLDQRYDELKDVFIFGNGGANGRLTYYQDKNNICVLAEEKGLNIPKSFVVSKGEILDEFEYPVITKAISSNAGAWKRDSFVCKDKEELIEAYNNIQSETLLVQKYIEKKNELCIDGFSVNHGNDVVFTIAATYNYIIPGKYAYDYSVTNLKDEKLISALKAMIKEIGYEGIFCIEFLVDKNDDLYFLEVNLRNSGWSWTSTCVNMNMPVLWAEGMLMNKIPENAVKIIDPPFRTIYEFADFSTRVMGKKISLIGWIKDLKNVDCFLLFDSNDKKPFFVSLLQRVKNKVIK